MDRQTITITSTRNFLSSLIGFSLKLMPVLLVLSLGNSARAADDENSFGFLFDHFRLTLQQGWRTEAAGPFYYSQQTKDTRTVAFPPFFSRYRNPGVESGENDYLYPLCTSLHYGKERRWQLFQLLSFSGGQEQDGAVTSQQTVFPFFFRQRSTDTNLNYTALFPFYGTVKNRLFRDEIHVVMFPFYSQTRKRDVVTDNYLYPFVDVRRGNGLHGWSVWPFVGREHKIVTLHTNGFGDVETVGGHDHSFILWPLYLSQDNGIGTDNPQTFRASIPFFVYSRSPQVDMTSVLWPLFNWIDNRQKQYREWQTPWPIVIFARGKGKTTSRVFPLFQRSHDAVKESDFYLWPIYTYRRTHSDPLDLRRRRVVFYLYSDMVEKNTATGHYKRRLDMWPFFTWHRDFDGRERLQIFAPVEPAVPDNRGIERNWSPLWSLWRAQSNPKTGASSHSLLWNLYRDEESPAHKKISLLFGLFQYQSDGGNRRTKLFYITVSHSQAKSRANAKAKTTDGPAKKTPATK